MLDDTYTDTVAYQATPGVGAQLDASGNTNRAYAIADDMTGSSGVGVGVGGTYSAYQSTTATANDTIPQADLSIAKTNGTAFVSGANGMYSIVVTNKGPDPAAEPITVSDVLPTGEGFVSASGTGWACANASGTVSCSSGSSGSTAATGLVAGTISLLVNVASSVTPGTGAITNTAKVSDTGPYDPVSSDNSSSDPTTVQGADLAIHKSHSGTFTAGQSGTYSLVVTNNGPADSAGPITVSDTLPAGETLASTPTGTGWICSNLASVVTCTHATAIADGTSAGTISLPVDIASSATGKIINTATVTPGPTDDPDSSNNSSSDQVTIATSADLNIEKTLTLPAGGLVSGQDATYTIKVNNLGPSDAVAPQVQDVLPAGESFVSASGTDWNCSNTNGTVGCTYTAATSLSDGASASPITLVVSVSSAAVSTITNTAIVCSGTIGTGSNLCTGSTYANGTLDPITENNTSSAPGTPAVSADLTIQKSHAGNFVSGANGTYSITVTDDGPADSVGTSGSPIVVSDTLPSGESYVSATGTGWTCTAASQIVTCDYASVIVADTSAPMISLVVAVSSSALGTVTNTVQVTPGVTADGNPANNSASDPTTIVGADLSITKTHSGSFTAGSEGTYTITVSNNGPATSAGPINVIDTLPTGESYVSANATGWTCSDGSGSSSATVTCTNPSSVLANAAMAPISLVVAIGVDVTDTLTNTAEVVPGPTADPVTSNNTTTDPTAVLTGADLAIHKSHSGTFTAGQSGTYSLVVTNNGPADSAGPITVSDTLPAGETLASTPTGTGWICSNLASVVTCTHATAIADGTSAGTISLPVDIASSATGKIINTATVTPGPTDDPDSSNNSSSDQVTIATSADLNIEKTLTLPAGGLVSGQDATYTIKVNNLGPSDAVAPQVQDVLPAGESFVSASGTDWNCSNTNGTVGCTYTAATSLSDGASASPITLVVSVSSAAVSTITNTAIVCSGTIGTGSNLCTGSTYANGTLDPITENNTSSAPGTPAVSADLTIQKSHAGNFVSGANGTYSITVTDDGPADSVGTSGSPIVVSDTLPSGESYVSATGTGWTCTAASQIVTCDYASVIVADTSAPMISLVVAVSSSALGTVTNTVQVTPGVTADGNPANNSASDPTTIVGADLSITKTHSGSFTAGSEGTYTITVSNNGPATSAGPINVIDTLPTGESYVSANATGWTCSDGSGSSSATVTCTNPSSVLANAAMAPISLVVAIGVDVTDTLTNTAEVVPGPTADPVTSNNTTTDPTAVLTGADLAIHKSHSGTFILDEHGTYDLAVTNNGPAASGPITVSDTLPAGETFVSAGGSGWSCTSSTAGASSQPTVTCSLQARLGPDSAAPMISLVVDVGVGAYPSVTNTAKVSSPTTDPNLSNNSSSDTLSPTPVTGLRIEKTLRTALVSGTHALYSVVVTDSGPSPAAQVVVTDPMPSGLVPLSGTGPGWHCGIVAGTNEMRCTTATLGVDTPSTIMLAALVTAKAGDYLANTASVKSSTESIPNSRLTAESTTPGTKVQAGRGSPTPVSPKPPRPVSPKPPRPVSPKPPRPVSPKPPRPVSPKPPLAFTGFDLIPISVGGLLLILSGLATLEVVRRRRRLAGSRG
jgi:uncharacterized repeat protein (TIGR01451 family)